MGQVKCPICGRENSELSEQCERCGTSLKWGENNSNAQMSGGNPLPAKNLEVQAADEQPPREAANPVEATSAAPFSYGSPEGMQPLTQVKKNPRKTRNLVILVVVAVVVCAAAIFGIKAYNDLQAERARIAAYNQYIDDYTSTKTLMADSVTQCNQLSGLLINVWSNAIQKVRNDTTDPYTRPNGYFVSDFNEALSGLYADQTVKKTVAKILEDQKTITTNVERLKTAPEGLEKCRDALQDMDTAYQALAELATNPSGSLNSYTSEWTVAGLANVSTHAKADQIKPEKLPEK